MKFLASKTVTIQDIPFKTRESGGYYPIESLILREYRKIAMSSGLDAYEIAMSISKNPDILNDKGEQYSFQECVNLVLKQDPVVVANYKDQIKKAFFSTLDIPEKFILVSAFFNTRVPQSWHKKNREEIEEGLANEPSLEGWDIVFPEFEESFAMSLLNSDSGAEPVYNEKEGKLYWTLQQTFRLGEDVIDEIYQKVFLNVLEKPEDEDSEDKDPDFLSVDSEIV